MNANATTSDPFAEVVTNLKQALTNIQSIQEPVKLADGIVIGIDDVLHTLHDTVPVLGVIDSTSTTLAQVIKPLDAIPGLDVVVAIVDEIWDFMDTALTDIIATAEEIDTTAIQPAIEVMDEVHHGLGITTDMVTTVSVQVPQYLNTVTILSFLLDIGTPLSQVLKGTEPGDRLNKFVGQLNTIRTEVTGPLEDFLEIIKPITDAIKFIVDKVKELLGKDALDAVNWVATKIHDIYHNVMKVLSAIAPVRWALDAIQWVMDHVLKPVIKWILHITKLDQLEHKIVDEIEEKLGVKSFFEAAQKQDGSGMDGVNPKNANSATDIFVSLGKDLEEYSGNKNQAIKDAAHDLIAIIFGTPVDPKKVAPVPHWNPDPPELHGNNSSSITLISTATPWEGSPCQRAFTAVAGTHSTLASASHSAPLLLTPLMLGLGDDATPFSNIDSKNWPHAAKLVDEIARMIQQAGQLQTTGQALVTAMSSLDKSFKLPRAFSHQTNDLATSLKTADDALTFIEEFNISYLDAIVEPVKAVVKSQAADVDQVSIATPLLSNAVLSLENAAQSVVAAIPQVSILADTTTTLDGWTISINQLVNMVDMAANYDAKDENKHGSGISSLREQIEQSADQVLKRVSAIDDKVKGLTVKLSSLQHALDTYANSLNPISSRSQSLSEKSLPALHKVAYTLGIIDSIFDPLESLLTAGGCVDGDHRDKKNANQGSVAMEKTAKTMATPPDGELDQLAIAIAQEALPLGALAKDVTNAANLIDKEVVTAFTNNANNLENELKDLGGILISTQAYTMPGPDGKPLTLNNDFIDQEFVKQAQALLKEIPVPSND